MQSEHVLIPYMAHVRSFEVKSFHVRNIGVSHVECRVFKGADDESEP